MTDVLPHFGLRRLFTRLMTRMCSGAAASSGVPSVAGPVGSPAPLEERDIIAASVLFDVDWYLAQNRDAAARMDPSLHYILHGAAEGRDPGPRFSTSGYLVRYPDVERQGINPLLHYLLHGSAEGRHTSPSTGFAQHWRGREARAITSAQTIPSVAKQEYQEQLVAEFKDFLASGDRLSVGTSHDHSISIIVVVHNKPHFTYAWLRSIAAAAASGTGIQLVIVDSGSTDDTGDLLTRLDDATVTVTRLVDNAGFLRSVNRGVEDCSGDYIILLNNDAILHDGALDYALETIRQDPMIAAVGGKVILPSGALQEAGCKQTRDNEAPPGAGDTTGEVAGWSAWSSDAVGWTSTNRPWRRAGGYRVRTGHASSTCERLGRRLSSC